MVIRQLQEENQLEKERRQELEDGYVQKKNERDVEIVTLTTEIEELKNENSHIKVELANVNRAANDLKAERSAKNKVLKQLQEDVKSYKEKYEESVQSLGDLQRSHRNLNAMVERFLESPAANDRAQQQSPCVQTTVQQPTPSSAANNRTQQQGPHVETSEQQRVAPPLDKHEGECTSMCEKKRQVRIQKPEEGNHHPALAVTLPNSDVQHDENQRGEPKDWGSRMEKTTPEDTIEDYGYNNDVDGNDETQTMSRVYLGNIPPNFTEGDIKDIFGHYINHVNDITITKVVKGGRQRSLYAMINTPKENEEDLLSFNGLTVLGNQIVVEIARKPPGQLQRKTHQKMKKDCRFYLQGRCTKPNCSYEHREPCKFFKKGSCKFKDSCKYAHLSKRDSREKMEGNDILSTVLKALLPQLTAVSRN